MKLIISIILFVFTVSCKSQQTVQKPARTWYGKDFNVYPDTCHDSWPGLQKAVDSAALLPGITNFVLYSGSYANVKSFIFCLSKNLYFDCTKMDDNGSKFIIVWPENLMTTIMVKEDFKCKPIRISL